MKNMILCTDLTAPELYVNWYGHVQGLDAVLHPVMTVPSPLASINSVQIL